MKTRIVRIGNSKGVRIPKALLERSGLAGEVEIGAGANRIIITSARRPRQDWPAAFQSMAKQGDDQLLDNELLAESNWVADEWEW